MIHILPKRPLDTKKSKGGLPPDSPYLVNLKSNTMKNTVQIYE